MNDHAAPRQTPTGRVALTAAALATAMAWAAPAAAQTVGEGPSPKQVELYEQARRAYDSGQYERSIALLDQALDGSAWNLFLASKGLAHARLGRCQEALEAYRTARAAPAVPEPRPEQVARKLDQYEEELMAQCPATLHIVCDAPDVEVALDDGPLHPCPDEPLTVAAGTHRLRSLRGERMVIQAINLEMDGSHTVYWDGNPRPAHLLSAEAHVWTLRDWSWLAVGAGGAIVATALFGEVLWVKPAIEAHQANPQSATLLRHAEDRQDLNLTLYTVGGLVGAVGAAGVLFLEPTETDRAKGVSGWVNGDGGGVQWMARW